jgi:uncharacterized damage-inducible protein DinB
MYTTVTGFLRDHAEDCGEMQRNLDALTDASLAVAASPGSRSIGGLAVHIVNCWPEALQEAGLGLAFPLLPEDATAAQIAAGFKGVTAAVQQQVAGSWTDHTLAEPVEMWGMSWNKAKVLYEMLKHTIHHHGQLTALMRQAGLKVHGVYGPSFEEAQGGQ